MHVEGFHADVGGPIARLSHNLGSNTSSRSGHYIVASEDGSRIAYVWDTNSSYQGHNRELIGYARNIKFNASSANRTNVPSPRKIIPRLPASPWPTQPCPTQPQSAWSTPVPVQ